MIEVKSFKPQTSSPPSAEQLYRSAGAEAAPSRWPAVIVLTIMAVALYLRSLFPSFANSDLGPPSERPVEEAAGGDPTQMEQDTAENPEDETGSLGDKEEPVGSGGPGTAVAGLADFLGIDSPPIDYKQLPLPRYAMASVENGFGRERAGNDNLSALSGSVSIGASGGVGLLANLPVMVGSFTPIIVTPGAEPGPGPGPDSGPGSGDDDGDYDDDPGPIQRNRAPLVAGPVALASIGICKSVLITSIALLAGASDADADTLSVTNLRVSSGTVTAAEGGWLYTPAIDYYGPVTFSYDVSDAALAVAQTASFSVVEFVEIIGTPEADTLVGTECVDFIDGREGNDTIDARGGSDIIHGGAGNDIIRAGSGLDLVYAGRGDDIVHCGAGNDTIYGGAGNDQLFGDDGDDIIHGDEGNDLIRGGAGNDILSGGAGDDEIHGDEGDDTIAGDEGRDDLHGEEGDDHLIGGADNDRLSGGSGNDILDGGEGDDVLDGGSGRNTIFTGNGTNSVSAGDGDNTVIGGSGQDQVRLGAGQDVARLGAGNDFVAAGAGNDQVFGEDGDDTLFGEAGDDFMDAGNGDDHLVGGSGADTLDGGADHDIIDAGSGDDKVKGGTGDDIVLAGEGCDRVEGGGGEDRLFGGAGADAISGDEGNDVVDGEAGDDCLLGNAGNDAIFGGAGDDAIEGGSGEDTLDGGAGEDVVRAGSGDDRIVATLDAEADCYDGGSGMDTLDLSQAKCDIDINLTAGTAIGIEIGEDQVFDLEAIIGGEGNDTFTVGAKSMSLTGGAGDDTFTFAVSCDDEERDLIHEILDLEAGDRIIVKQYQIQIDEDGGPAAEGDEDPFDTTYGENAEGHRPFRFRIEKVGDDDYTFVDVYVEQQDDKEFSIEIAGAHRLYYV